MRQQSPAYIIKTQSYRETSLLIDLFTLEFGRLRGVLKGAKKKKSAHLQAFTQLSCEWVSSASGLASITQIEPLAGVTWFKGEASIIAMYLNELLLLLLHEHEPAHELYYQYAKALVHIEHDSEVEQSLRKFELILLEHVGAGVLDRETADTHQPIQTDHYYGYAQQQGILANQALGDVQNLLGASLLEMASDQPWSLVALKDAKKLLRYAIDRQIAPKTIQSRLLLKQMRQMKEQP